MTEKTWKRSMHFSQSVSSGIIAFSGEINFDGDLNIDDLVKMLKEQEQAFRDAGYKVATDIKPKETKD